MPETSPRYEFRIFAENLVPVLEELKDRGGNPQVRESEEVYLVSEYCWDNNFKIRDGRLEIKVLVQVRDGLEQWVPRVKMSFPVEGENVRDVIRDVIPDDIFFDITPILLKVSDESISQEKYLDIMKNIPGVRVVEVNKVRYGFIIGDCLAEFAELIIDGKMMHTAAVGSANPAGVLRLMKELDIEKRENVNFPLAIRRMVGLEPEIEGNHC